MAFKDFGDPRRAKPIVLPIRGRDYTFPGSGDIAASTWLKLQDFGELTASAAVAKRDGKDVELDAELLTELDQRQLMRELCGDELQRMLDDGVSGNELRSVLKTLMAAHMFSEELAEMVWNQQGEAEGPDPETSEDGSRASLATSPDAATDPDSNGPPSSATGS